MPDNVTIQTLSDTIEVDRNGGTVTIAEAGARGIGVPAGGTTGQVLAKASGDDYDTEWVTGGGGGGSSTFVGLTDTPGAFTASRIVAVNSAGDALEFPTASAARTLLGLGTAAVEASSAFAAASHTHTLSDVTDAGTAAASDTGDFDAAGTAASAVAAHAGTTTGVHGISAYGATLVDDASASAARTTLGLGSAATADTGDFAAASHNHTASEITDFATAADARIAAASLADLSDVGAFSGLDTFDVLAWDGVDWGAADVRVFIASYLTGTAVLGDLSDVTIATPATGQVPRWNGSLWVNAALDYSDLAGVPSEFTPEAHTHTLSDITDAGTAAGSDTGDFATAAQGALADSATQPGDLATVATTGAYSDLTGIPSTFNPASHTLGSHSNVASGADSPATGNFLYWTGLAWDDKAIETSDIKSGTLADARVASSNVTQHQGDLSILGSQVTGKQGPGAAFDGQGAAIEDGVVVRSPVTEAGTVSTIYADADQSGSVSVICRWYDATDTGFASPTVLGTLSISSAQKGSLGSLSQAVDPGDTLEFEIDGAATSIQRLAVRARI